MAERHSFFVAKILSVYPQKTRGSVASKQTKKTTIKNADKKSASIVTPKKLTKKQQKFCKYIANGYNATQAALKAGYSPKSARKIASENRTKPDIAAKLEEEAIKSQAQADAELLYNKKEQFKELEETQELAKKKGNLNALLSAIVQKGKLCGLYIEKQEVAIKEPKRFVVEIIKPK